MEILIQVILNGLSVGAVYSLVALGYTMVYGVLQFINFAHAELFMLGAFVGLFAAKFMGAFSSSALGVIAIFLVTMLLCVVIGLLIETIAYRPLRKAPRLNVLITAIGVSFFLQNFGVLNFGADPKVFPQLIASKAVYASGDILITNIQLLVLAISFFLMLGLHFFVNKTKMGLAMRAVSYDVNISRLMGIRTDWVIGITFAIGSALAGGAAILYGVSYPKIEPMMGVIIGIKAFVAAVLGGIGNFVGAALGGLVIGLAESLVVYYISSSYRDAISFGILIFVLLVKPEGLLGKVIKEKV